MGMYEVLGWALAWAIVAICALGIWLKKNPPRNEKDNRSGWTTAFFISFMVFAFLAGSAGHVIVTVSPKQEDVRLAELKNGHVVSMGKYMVTGWRADLKAFEYPLTRQIKFMAPIKHNDRTIVTQAVITYGCQNSLAGVEKWFRTFPAVRASEESMLVWKSMMLLTKLSDQVACPSAIAQRYQDSLEVFMEQYGLRLQAVRLDSLDAFGYFYH